MSAPSITPAQRAYLAAFDRHLREASGTSRERMRHAVGPVLREANVTPETDAISDPTLRPIERQEPRMEERTVAPRPVDQVLDGALEELRRRESALQRVEGELQRVRAAIKALEKIIGRPAARQRAPSGDTRSAILVALRDGALTVDEVGAAIGREPAGWLAAQLGRLVAQGACERVGERFQLARAREAA